MDFCERLVSILVLSILLLAMKTSHWHYILFFLLILFVCASDLFYAIFEDARRDILVCLAR